MLRLSILALLLIALCGCTTMSFVEAAKGPKSANTKSTQAATKGEPLAYAFVPIAAAFDVATIPYWAVMIIVVNAGLVKH